MVLEAGASVSRVSWSEAEDAYLLDLAESYGDPAEISRKLNRHFNNHRTWRAAYQRLVLLRGSLTAIRAAAGGSRAGTRWTDVEVQRLRELDRLGVSPSELAQRFPGRTRWAVLTKLQDVREGRLTAREGNGLLPSRPPPPGGTRRRCLKCGSWFDSPDRRGRWLCDACGARNRTEYDPTEHSAPVR